MFAWAYLKQKYRSSKHNKISTLSVPLSNIASYCVLGDCLKLDLAGEILCWPLAVAGCEVAALISYLTGRINTPLSELEVRKALSELEARGLAVTDGVFFRLSEPDRPELELYEPLSKRLTARNFLSALNVAADTFVFQDTSTGGRIGTGPLSRPDFTLAAIKNSEFEQALEITTIEVKNRSGANVASVFEVIAHSRISHFPYLACPRSRLDAAKVDAIRRACDTQKVGLILFDIEENGLGKFTTGNLKIDIAPKRFSPKREDYHVFLNSRLTAQNCAKLRALAKGN